VKTFNQINVIPFIDIMLVLLAIVLTTATFISQGLIKVNLPDADSAVRQTQQPAKTLQITLNANQQIYVANQLIKLDKLDRQLQTTAKKTAVVLRVDKSVRFAQFVRIIDLLKKYQLENLSIMTTWTGS